MRINKIRRVKIQEVWPNEAYDFTPWLEKNIDVLGETIGTDFCAVERERPAGTFSADLVAQTANGRVVVIENQYGKSNHDHLGKLLTYSVSFEAGIVVWIAESPRPEHIAVLSWLNETTTSDFYLVKIEAVCIGDSDPAALMTLIIGPSAESKARGTIKKELIEDQGQRHQFWTKLLDVAKERTPLHKNISPSTGSWVATSAGIPGALSYNTSMHKVSVDLYIDQGKDSDAANKEIFDVLHKKKSEIESSCGLALQWDRGDNKRSCVIRHRIEIGGWKDVDKWDEIIKALVTAMIKFEAALRPWLKGSRTEA